MSATDTPGNPNPLYTNQFSLRIQQAPEVNYSVFACNYPGLTLPPVRQENPFSPAMHAGDDIVWEPFTFTFQVDEELNNWTEMFSWMYGLGFPYAHSDYAALDEPTVPKGTRIKSDVSLFVLSARHNPVYEMVMVDAFPTYLSGWRYSSQSQVGQPIFADCRMVYNRYYLRRIGSG